MANTITQGRGTITIVPDGTTDFIAGTNSELSEYLVCSVQFIPSAANDRLIVRDKTITGVKKFDSGPAAGTSPILETVAGGRGQWMMPVIDASECTFGTPANCTIIIDYL